MAQKQAVLIGLMVTGALAVVIAVVAVSRNGNETENSMNGMTSMPPEQDQSMGGSSTQQSANSVTIKDYTFTPGIIKVKKGTTVTWTNQDTAKHNVTVLDGQPEGGPVDGKLMAKGESYEFTFNTVGTYQYKCAPHPYMKATVEVTE